VCQGCVQHHHRRCPADRQGAVRASGGRSSASPARLPSARSSTSRPSVRRAAARPRLGGNAPFVGFDDADIDAAVEGAIVSSTATWARPASRNRLYAQDKIYDEFVQKTLEEGPAMKNRDGTESGVTQAR